MRVLPLTSFVFMLGVLPARAGTIHVLPDGTGDVPTIADAFAIAVFGDTISLGDGDFFEQNLAMKSGVHLQSDSGDPSRTAVDAGGTGRCLVGPLVTGAPTIAGITFRNGADPAEGGLLLAGHHNARYRDCVFRDGAAGRGGAVAMKGTSLGHAPAFVQCRFESNEATSGDGGAIWSEGTGAFDFCEFVENTAPGRGGAIFSQKSGSNWGTRAQSCLFANNVAQGDGGAIHSTGTSFPYGSSIVACLFRDNAAANGGACRLNGFDFVASSELLGNTATGWGGALLVVGITPDKDFDFFSRNTLARNSAGTNGGAVAVSASSTVILELSTFAANEAPEGGHLWSAVATPWGTLRNCILAFATDGGAAAGSPGLDAICNDVFGNEGGDWVGPLAGQDGVNGNFSSDPLFCGPETDDFTLRDDSACLDPVAPECGIGAIGAHGLGCTAVSVAETMTASTWGRIKARFR